MVTARAWQPGTLVISLGFELHGGMRDHVARASPTYAELDASRQMVAKLAATQAIAGLHGLHLTSLVLPRNQWNPRYADAVIESGFTCFRGPQPSWAHQSRANAEQGRVRRVARLVDTYGGVTPPP